jgi:hypothetical protein
MRIRLPREDRVSVPPSGGLCGGDRRGSGDVGTILTDMHDKWQSGERRSLFEGSMAQLKPTSDADRGAAIDSDE